MSLHGTHFRCVSNSLLRPDRFSPQTSSVLGLCFWRTWWQVVEATLLETRHGKRREDGMRKITRRGVALGRSLLWSLLFWPKSQRHDFVALIDERSSLEEVRDDDGTIRCRMNAMLLCVLPTFPSSTLPLDPPVSFSISRPCIFLRVCVCVYESASTVLSYR